MSEPGDVDLSAEARTAGGSSRLGGHLARPAGDGPWPGVVVLHEIFGLDRESRLHTDRLARMGYLALAPDLFSDGGAKRCLVSTMRSLLSGKGRAYADIAAARAHLKGHPDSTGTVGVIGFCMGGGFALMTLTDWAAAAPNYGTLPRHLDDALVDACPVVASYGGRDNSLRGAAGKLEAALTGAGVTHDVKEYPDAGHSFLNEHDNAPALMAPFTRVVMHAGPEPDAAADAWGRIESFFGEHLH